MADSYRDSLAAGIAALGAAFGDNFIPQKRENTADSNTLSSAEVAALCDNFIRHVDHFLGSQETARIFSQRNAPDRSAALSRLSDMLAKAIKKCGEGTFSTDEAATLRECLGKDMLLSLDFGKKLVQLVGTILAEALWLLDNGPALAEVLERRGFDSSGVLRVLHRASESGYGSPSILPKWESIKVALQRAAIQFGKSEPTRGDPPPSAVTPKQTEGKGGAGSTPLAAKKTAKRNRGRKLETDPKADKKVADAWATGQYKTYAELGQGLGKSEREVYLSLERHRARQKRKGRGRKYAPDKIAGKPRQLHVDLFRPAVLPLSSLGNSWLFCSTDNIDRAGQNRILKSCPFRRQQ